MHIWIQIYGYFSTFITSLIQNVCIIYELSWSPLGYYWVCRAIFLYLSGYICLFIYFAVCECMRAVCARCHPYSHTHTSRFLPTHTHTDSRTNTVEYRMTFWFGLECDQASQPANHTINTIYPRLATCYRKIQQKSTKPNNKFPLIDIDQFVRAVCSIYKSITGQKFRNGLCQFVHTARARAIECGLEGRPKQGVQIHLFS